MATQHFKRHFSKLQKNVNAIDKKKKICFLFPGLGSQYVGMCKDLAQNFPYIQSYLDECNEILGYNLSDGMFNSDMKTLSTVKYGGMAMYVHSMAIWKVLQREYEIDSIFDDPNIYSMIVGHSMGECAAMHAANLYVSSRDALEITSTFERANSKYGDPNNAEMCVLISDAKDQKNNFLNNSDVYTQITDTHNIAIANVNTPNQIVLSGYKHDLKQCLDALIAENGSLRYKTLDIAGGYHSFLIKDAFDGYYNDLQQIPFNECLKCDVYMNGLGNLLEYKPSEKGTKSDNDISYLLAKQLYSQVRFLECITNYMKNVESKDEESTYYFVEIGPKKVLQKVVQQILKYYDYDNSKSIDLMSIDYKTIKDIERIF